MRVLKKCLNYRFIDIFWNVLNKIKDNFRNEWVKGGFDFSRAKI